MAINYDTEFESSFGFCCFLNVKFNVLPIFCNAIKLITRIRMLVNKFYRLFKFLRTVKISEDNRRLFLLRVAMIINSL